MKRFVGVVCALLCGATIALGAQLATVNGEAITSEDINLLLSQQGVSFETLPEESRQKLIQDVINQKLLVQQARKTGVESDPDFIRALAIAKDAITLELWQRKQFDTLKAGDSDAKKLYEEYEKQIDQTGKLCARHILVNDEADAKAIIKTLSGKKSAELETAFGALAQEKSTDPGSKPKGGDLGCFEAGQMVKEFSDATAKLKKGEVVKAPVKSQFGYHIIYRKAHFAPYDDVSARLKDEVKAKKFRSDIDKLIEDLKKKAKIEYSK
ncbi:putative peptidyl-prolyl cis-trans isomerase Cbf2 [Campylobacterota bacterium]|nr:putative peptidyl-prolyl cis-trans isomerase Cbf2 [Campylobacterota bacterium]